MPTKTYTAIGLMSGTSMDGIDAALLETDGQNNVTPRAFLTQDYTPQTRDLLREVTQNKGDVAAMERVLTDLHIHAVKALLEQENLAAEAIDLIGFHGHTIAHDPAAGKTVQIGDGAKLAKATGIDVVYQLRQNDMRCGGQGAPLVPIYHQAMLQGQDAVIINIGGVANMTCCTDKNMTAFDIGPGNALMDDWMQHHYNLPYDEGGVHAQKGKIDHDWVQEQLAHPFFATRSPKSLDRYDFSLANARNWSKEDGIATLTYFTAAAILHALEHHISQRPKTIYIAGGGAYNTTLTQYLAEAYDVQPVDVLGFAADAIEAQAFAYLAVRSHLKLPITFPGTTGVNSPALGGVFCPS